MKEKRYLTIKDVAEQLGLHKTTIYRLVKKGELPAFKVGNQWRFDKNILEEWISNESNKERLEKEAREKESTGEQP